MVISQYKKRNGIYINNENPSKKARVVIMIKINASNAASFLEERFSLFSAFCEEKINDSFNGRIDKNYLKELETFWV